MKTVSTAFKDAQKSPAAVSVRRVSYKRRYWVEASKAYTWESSWTVLPENEIVSVSPITGKLDTDKLNEFKISNVNLVLKNERRQWKAGKRGGYFGATTAYPDGFEPYWTKFKIESGYEVSGVATYVPLFVGVATGFSTSAASDTIQVDVRGLEALLDNANAEDVAVLVSLENMGTGNGSNKDFTTVQPGVGIIKAVYLAGVLKKPGTDYTISQTDDPTQGAKISFATAPASGAEVRITYRYWKQNQMIENVIGDLLTAANIPGGSRSIGNVLFPNGVIQNFKIDTQGDWASGTKTLVDVNRSPGDLTVDFMDSSNMGLLDDFNSTPLNTNRWTVYGNADTSSYPGYLFIGGAVKSGVKAYGIQSVYGTWEFKAAFPSSNAHAVFGFLCNYTITSDPTYALLPAPGYGIQIENQVLYLNRYSGSGVATTLASYTINHLGAYKTYRISRNPGGKINIYYEGSLIISVTDNTYNTGYFFSMATNSTSLIWCDYLNIPTTYASGSWVSQTLDCSTTPSLWGSIVKNETNIGNSLITTSTSNDGTSWDSYVGLGPSDQIMSSLKRYLKIKIDISANSYGNDYSIQSITIPYTSSATRITIPNFADSTVYQAIQKIGAFANYEWGFDPSEVFFFRQKQVDKTIDETLDGSTNLTEISNVSDGIDRVYSEVQATYGSYDITVGDDGVKKDSPILRFGKRRLTIDGGDILISSDTDVATGVANFFYSYFKSPRQKFKVRTKLMEWLDLSDTVSLTFNDNIPARPWTFGDTSVNFGDQSLYFFGDADQTAKGMLCKVVGYRHDTENKISEFDLEEII